MAFKSSTKWKDVGISVDSKVIRKLPRDPKKMDGMKKGSGQLPSGFATGVSGDGAAVGEALGLLDRMLRLNEEAPAIEDITDSQPVSDQPTSDQPQDSQPQPGDQPVPIDGDAPEAAADRYVKGAHMISKTQSDTSAFEELWIYRIDSAAPSASGAILKAILAGTDIPENKTRSDDGTQNYTLWTAGDAQYLHITGLSN